MHHRDSCSGLWGTKGIEKKGQACAPGIEESLLRAMQVIHTLACRPQPPPVSSWGARELLKVFA